MSKKCLTLKKYIKLKDNNRVSMVTNGLKVATTMDGYFAEKATERTRAQTYTHIIFKCLYQFGFIVLL